MNKTSFGLKMKESQLVHYLEEHTETPGRFLCFPNYYQFIKLRV